VQTYRNSHIIKVQELPTLLEHMISPLVFSRVRVVRSLVFWCSVL